MKWLQQNKDRKEKKKKKEKTQGNCLKKCFAWLRLMLEELLHMLFVSDRELSWYFSSLEGYLSWTDTTWTTQAESVFMH